MTIFSRHPYSFLFAGAGIVLLVLIMSVNATHAPEMLPPTATVSSGSLLVNPIVISAPISSVSSESVQTSGAMPDLSFLYSQPINTSPSTSPGSNIATNVPNSQTTSVQTNTGISAQNQQLLDQVYSLIPSGVKIINTSGTTRTPTQQALYEYGNAAGQAVLTFENAHADMVDNLKQWLAARGTASGRVGVERIAADLITAGDTIVALQQVPESVKSANEALGASYQNVGIQLHATVAADSDDKTLGEAMQTYNKTVESFTKNYIAISSILSLNAVNFSPTDPGSVFMFSGGGGL